MHYDLAEDDRQRPGRWGHQLPPDGRPADRRGTEPATPTPWSPPGAEAWMAATGDLGDVRLTVVRDQEYRQIFAEAWRVQRDWFYDPGMHGVDWAAVREKYARFLPWCGHRDDLRYLIGEMIAELNIGPHLCLRGRPAGRPHARRHRPARLRSRRRHEARALPHRAHPARLELARDGLVSPLAAPGVDVREGDYLLAIDGRAAHHGRQPVRLLVDRAGDVVELRPRRRPATRVDRDRGRADPAPRTRPALPHLGGGQPRPRCSRPPAAASATCTCPT